MELTDRGAVSITLRPLRYESPESVRGDGNDWVVIFGQVAKKADRWSFDAALLLSSELKELSDWLRGVASGAVPTATEWLEETHPRLLHPLTGGPLTAGSQVFATGDGVFVTDPGIEIEGPYPGVRFTEPGLSLSLSARSAEGVTLLVEFWKIRQQPFSYPGERSGSYSLTMSAAEMGRAVGQWDQECTAAPNGAAQES